MHFDIRLTHSLTAFCGLLSLANVCSGDDQVTLPSSAPAAATQEAPPYSVECAPDAETGGETCLVDKATYVGWRTFNSTCYVCHGQDAVGTTFAPSLVERLQVIDKARFMDVVHNGFQGQIGVMPAWKDNPNVNKHFEELYSYIKARSDGVLPPGRPERKPE
jgi:mono/diheme cytochrome c family protein